MTARTLTAGAVLAALLAVGCHDAAPDARRTDDLSRSLLSQSTPEGPSTSFQGDQALLQQATTDYIPDLGYNFGAEEAPVKLIEFSDFGCGYCRRFHQETFPGLKTQFIDTDMVEWKFMPFITGMFEHSMAASEGAECTLEQDATSYEALIDRLWEQQPDWKGTDEAEAVVRGWVAELGLDMSAYDECVSADRRTGRIASATLVAQKLGVRGTPTFWIVGFGPLQGALPLDAFQEILGVVHNQVVAGGPR